MGEMSDWLNCECPTCGKKFHLKPSAIKRFKRHFCSKECFRIAKADDMSGENNHQYGLKGKKNASWKSDKRISRYGYRQVRCIDHPFRDKEDFVFEHRLVAEKYLLNDENSVMVDGKRYLSPDYVVHHKNFNRLDNNIWNLQVMEKSEHQRLHMRLNAVDRNREDGRFMKSEYGFRVKRVTETAVLPKRATLGSGGFDLCVDSDVPVKIKPHETVVMKTGLAFALPEGYVAEIFARSGISTKRGLRPSTCVSIIDWDYRGEVSLPIYNDSSEEQIIQPYERVAQAIFVKCVTPELILVDRLDETERGTNGFGSSGI